MSIITETNIIFDNLTQFFKDQSTYLLSGGIPPSTSTIEDMSYSELLTYSTQNSSSGVGFGIGSSQEAVFTAVSVSREILMAKLSKAELYNNHLSDMGEESLFYASSGAYLSGIVSGNPTTGSKS